MGNPSPRRTAELKQKAVELYRKSGTTYAEVVRLGQEGRRRRPGGRRQPVPDGRGPAQAEEEERAAQARERDTFKSERLLRQRRRRARRLRRRARATTPGSRARRARVRQATLGREVGVQARIGAGPGGAQIRSRRPQRGVVRRHRLRQDPPGLAAFGARDGHMVAAHGGIVDVPEHRGRAGRRGIEDGAGQEKPARGMRPSRRLRLAIRVAASAQDHAGERHPAVDGAGLVAVGRRGHGVAHGHRNRSACTRAPTPRARRPRWTCFERIEVACNRARIHSALGYLSPAKFEGANWPAEEGRPKAA